MKKPSKPSKLAILTITFSYLILNLLFFLSFSKIISQIDYTIKIAPVALLFAILIPIIFIALLTIKVFQIFKDAKKKSSSTKFKTKVILFFSLIAALGMIPQTGLALIFIQNTAKTWLPDNTIPTLTKTYNSIVQNYTDKLEDIDELCENSDFVRIFKNTNYNNSISVDNLWKNIKLIKPEIKTVQVFKSGVEILSLGSENLGVKNGNKRVGNLGKETKKDINNKNIELTRYNKEYTKGGEIYNFIITFDISSNFSNLEKPISDSLSYYKKLDSYKNAIPTFMLIMFCLIFIPIFFIILLLSLYITEEITRPIASIEEASKNVAAGDFSIRIIEKEQTDFNTVINSFNTMISELERKNDIQYEDKKIDTLLNFSNTIKKNMNYSLLPIKDAASEILEISNQQNMNKKVVDNATKILNLSNNIFKSLDDIDKKFKNKLTKISSISMKDCILKAIDKLDIDEEKINIEIKDINDEKIEGDEKLIIELFYNIIKNSIESTNSNLNIVITINKIRKNEKSYKRISIKDNGKGISEEDKIKIFLPYFSKKIGAAGMGLAISERIVFLHKGKIRFESNLDSGTTFYIDLPSNLG